MLCFTEISSQDCSQLRSWLNKDNLKLLNSKMGSTIPLQCIGHVANFSNNEEIHSHEIQGEDAKAATQEILQQTLHIFRQNHSQMDWGETSIAGFQAGLHQDIEKLGRCLGAEKGNSIRQRVKSYFRRINDYLKDDGYSLCAWEIVQMEVRQCFLLIDQLLKRTGNSGTCMLLKIMFVVRTKEIEIPGQPLSLADTTCYKQGSLRFQLVPS